MIRVLSCAILYGLWSSSLGAQAPPNCEDLRPPVSTGISRQTQRAGDRAAELVRAAGGNADLRLIRERVLKDEFPAADVDITVSRMLYAYCLIVLSSSTPTADDRVERVQSVRTALRKPVRGPSPIASTRRPIRPNGGPPRRGSALTLTSRVHLASWEGPDGHEAQRGAADEDFLRDPPSYVNDSNRYFVIVGSVPSEQGAIRLMNRLKAKAPRYDFVVYQPYGSNPYYAVMMATWVSRAVADRALRLARTHVVADAYRWACPSFGESC